jgi:hypothetical protein
MTTLLWIFAGLAIVAVVEAVVERQALRKKMEWARHNAPADPETALLTVEAFQARAVAELKRAERYKGTVSIGFWNVEMGDPVEFGCHVRETLRFPEVGFRMSGSLFAVVSPSDDVAARDALPSRIGVLDTGVRHGIATFPAQGSDLPELIRIARHQMTSAVHLEVAA